jgi:hypothetical protein
MRYGSKQDVHVISRGMLGDAMKQILSLGYILVHADDDGTEFKDKQWEYPLTIRHNGEECKIFLIYDKAKQEHRRRIEISAEFENRDFTYTEIEVVLPIIDQVRNTLDITHIEKFCKEYAILTTDVSFKFSILDESTEGDNSSARSCNISTELMYSLSTSQPKGKRTIEIPSLSSIATTKEWSNTDSIHSYSPAEFTSRITNVHHKQKTVTYDLLRRFREGTNL